MIEEIAKDKDSMDALQSLLQIRSRGYSEASSSASRQEANVTVEEHSVGIGRSQEQAPSGGTKRLKSAGTCNINSRSSSKNLSKRARIDQHHGSPSNKRKIKSRPQEPIQPQIQLQPRQESVTLPKTPSGSNPLQQVSHHHRGLFFPSHQQISSMALGSPLSSSPLNTNPGASATMAHIQLVAAQAAMAAAASAVASVSNGQRLDNSSSSHHRLLSPQQQHSRQQQPVTPPSTGSTLLSLDSTSLSTNKIMMDAAMEEASSCTTSSTNTTNSSSIRREKVEAALRSKPQRGKKRDDLSAKERLELTRTRNREHAKTTRIRKKARYQELLECETKLQVMLQQQATEELQRKAVATFVSLRQNMIRCCGCEEGSSVAESQVLGLDYMNDNHSSSPSLEMGKENDEPQVALKGSPSQVPPDQVKPVITTITKPVDHVSILAKLVEDVDQFELQVSPKVPSSPSSTPAKVSPLTSTMNTFIAMDRQLIDRAVERYGDGAQQYFVCHVSDAGIALNSSSTGTTITTAMAEIELHMELSPCNRTHLQTCLLQVKFAANQPVLLQSVSWTVLKDSLISNDHDQVTLTPNNKSISRKTEFSSSIQQLSRTVSSMKAAHEDEEDEEDDDTTNDSPLQSQSVFPSIVSLEQSKAAGGQGGSSTNDANTLGMPL